MKDLFRLVIVALIGYGLYSFFMARESVELDPADLEADSPSRCLERTDRAGDRLGSALRKFATPPIDQEAWLAEYETLDQHLELAKAACRHCSGDACHRAREALRQLTSLVLAYHDGFSSGTGPPHDGATRLDQFQRTLEAAHALDL